MALAKVNVAVALGWRLVAGGARRGVSTSTIAAGAATAGAGSAGSSAPLAPSASLPTRAPPAAPEVEPGKAGAGADDAGRNARAQQLFYIRTAAVAPAGAMDMWAISSKKMQKWIDARRDGQSPQLGHISDLDSIVKCVAASV